MEYAVSFAETGHLCVSTLHPNNANQALERIVNFFPEERRPQLLMDLSLNLLGIMSQRLIPTAEGGRCTAIEVLLASPFVKNLILQGEIHALKDIMEKSIDQGMKTLIRHSSVCITRARLLGMRQCETRTLQIT